MALEVFRTAPTASRSAKPLNVANSFPYVVSGSRQMSIYQRFGSIRSNTTVATSRRRYLIPSRDRLIVDTYCEHVLGRKAVVFCVNVRHGEELAERFRERDIPARSVSGRMPTRERQDCLQMYARGDIRVLCACDLLNEGWDCPDVEVLMMARPTLPKVIYLQQLGRGTRKAPGKECLFVFDFVDNATRYNSPLSSSSVGRTGPLPARSLGPGPSQLISQEQEALAGGKPLDPGPPGRALGPRYQEIDVFNWQEAVAGMVSTVDLEVELAAAEGESAAAIDRGIVKPDQRSLGRSDVSLLSS